MFLRRKSEDGLEVEIPVTPMLDMAFQLLTFFIFTYHPTEMEGQMEMTMGGGRGSIVAGQPLDPQPPADAGRAVVVRLRTQEGPEGGSITFPIEVEADLARGAAHSVDDLRAYLTQLRTSGQLLGKTGAAIESDRHMKWEFVVDVMDACKRSGLTVSLAAPADSK